MLNKLIAFFFVASLVSMISCSHFDAIQKELKESGGEEDESHNPGENCGSCHNKNGNEAAMEYWWTISGTVYDNNNKALKNVTVELWEKPGKQGKLIKRLVSDSKGNFYTNQILNFNNGCYPVISSGSKSNGMTQAFNGGSCNSCHGITTDRIKLQ